MTASTLSDRDHQFVARAVDLAKNGLYTTKPNPRVGCVVVQDEDCRRGVARTGRRSACGDSCSVGGR